MAESYSALKKLGFASKEEVIDRIQSLEQEIKVLKDEVRLNNHEMKAFSQTIKYVNDYRKYKPVYLKYEKSKNPERFIQNHLSEITLYQDAAEILKRSEIDPERLNLSLFKATYFDMKSQNEKATESLKSIEDQIKVLRSNLSNINVLDESREMPVKRRNGRDDR